MEALLGLKDLNVCGAFFRLPFTTFTCDLKQDFLRFLSSLSTCLMKAALFLDGTYILCVFWGTCANTEG